MEQIVDWLENLGLSEYAQRFAENGVGITALRHLTDQDLKDIGVLLGHRRIMLAAIGDLAEAAESVAQPAVGSEATPRDSAERRQVTVMFSDLIGSTALSARMDPEDLREVISAYQSCVAESVRRFGGFVAKYMGDGVLVYFGYPQAHEDDAERAVRAGLEAIAAVCELKSSVPLQTRVGIATGLVVVGDLLGSGEAQERGIIGETPNVAARLQGIAEPNAVVIAESTRRLLGNLFELEDLGTQALKGIAGPVPVWAALRPSSTESRFDALHGSRLAALVGREEELELLLRRWSRARTGEGQVVLLSGEAGIGKSRLTAALMERLAGELHTRLRYFCSPQHTDSALRPIIGHLERAAGFRHDDTQQVKHDKLDALLARTSTSIEDVALLADLLSLPSDGRYPTLELTPQRRRARTLEALVAQLVALTRQNPVLMIIEDAHWIDPTSLEAFGRIVDRIVTLPVLLVVTFRPEFNPPWIGQPHVTTMTINRLTQRDVGTLIKRVVGEKPLPANIERDIIERTDGIPLFVEELTKAVLEAESEGDAQRIAAAVPSPAPAIPASLHASLMARLDRLGLPAKKVAQVGSAIGREFSHVILSAVMRTPEVELISALDLLVTTGLLLRQGVPPDATYLFKHALVQDAAYSTLLRDKRHELHARIAKGLERLFPQLVEAESERVAQHFSAANLPENSVPYWSKAATRFRRSYAVAETIAMLNCGIADIERMSQSAAQDRLHVEFTQRLAQVIYMQGRFQDSVDVLEKEEERLTRVADPALTGPNNFWLAHMYSRLGKVAEADRRAQESANAAMLASDNVTLGKALGVMAVNACWAGRAAEGVELGRRAAEVLTSTAERHWLGMAHFNVAMNLIQTGDTQTALEAAETAMAVGVSISDPRVIAYGRFAKGWAHAAAGNHEAALRECQESLRVAPDAASRAYASAFLGYSYLVKGEPSAALDLLEQAVRSFSAFHFPAFEALFGTKLAETRLALGDIEGARTAATRGRTIAINCGYRYGLGWACRAMALTAAAVGQNAEARELLLEARSIFAEIGAAIEFQRTTQLLT
jgi:class 3 adenylate cyclase/tetratricopeptide (TPR) repeat protein